jgi:uncharacterized protein YjiS (DUF1127 family)
MHFENRLPGDRSSRRLIKLRDQSTIFLRYSAESAASAPRAWSYRETYRKPTQDWLNSDDRARRTSSDDDTSRHAISAAAASGVMAMAVRGLAAWNETAFPRLVFAIISWTMEQALAGCIAYAEAMYSVDLSEPMDGHAPAAGQQPENGQLRSQTSGPSELLPVANSGIGGDSPASSQTRSSAATLEAAYLVRSETARAAPLGWSASITALLAKFRSRIRRERDSRLAIAELRALDDRTLRDLGISRCDIEYFARPGDVCE